MVVAFIEDHRARFGVAPICRVLSEHDVPIAPNSYYAHKKRARSARSLRDERVLAEIVRVHTVKRPRFFAALVRVAALV